MTGREGGVEMSKAKQVPTEDPAANTVEAKPDLDDLFDGDPSEHDPECEPPVAIMAGSADRAAVYVRGQLHAVGDHYEAFLAAAQAAGIELLEDNAFLLGQDVAYDQLSGTVASTLATARHYSDLTGRAVKLRQQADTLLAQAGELESEANTLAGRRDIPDG